jgi:hypothetical protein
MRGEFRSYNAAYADALNEQMLLNLARLENGHPAYYLAIGSIDNRFIDTAAAAAGSTGVPAQNTTTSTTNRNPFEITRPGGGAAVFAQFPGRVLQTVAQSVFGYSANASYMHTKNPEFQFIPLNNETVARQILDPVLPDVFFTLYNQGYPLDQLMRVMIERVETTLPETREQVTFINSPAQGKAAESYARFLRGCAILREMQRLGYLTLESHTHYEPLGPISFDTPNKGGRTNPTSKEFAEAEKNGFELRQEEDPDDPAKAKHWEIERKHSAPVFRLKEQDAPMVIRKLSGDEKLRALPGPRGAGSPEEAIANLVGLLKNGIAVQTTVGDVKHATTRLVLRSFDRSMTAVATEQAAFDEFSKTEPEADILPEIERRPILRMMWTDKTGPLAPPLQTIHYSGKTYEVTDQITGPLEASVHWNRDVFRLLVALNSQVTVDISKFQRQVVELLPTQ